MGAHNGCAKASATISSGDEAYVEVEEGKWQAGERIRERYQLVPLLIDDSSS